jgi:hypothetical protein
MFSMIKNTIEKSAPVAVEKANEPRKCLVGLGMDIRKN